MERHLKAQRAALKGKHWHQMEKVTPLVRMFIVSVYMKTTRSTADEAAEFSADNNNVDVTSQPVSDRCETKVGHQGCNMLSRH